MNTVWTKTDAETAVTVNVFAITGGFSVAVRGDDSGLTLNNIRKFATLEAAVAYAKTL